MAEEFSFSVSDATIKNISELSKEQMLLEERRVCELYELADGASDAMAGLYEMGMSVYESLSLMSDALTMPVSAAFADAIDENILRLRKYADSMEAYDRVFLCQFLCERLSSKGFALCESDFLGTAASQETVAYVKNAYADEAYDVFSQELSDPRLLYVKSFKEALSHVASGDVAYALLPIEEAGSRLPTVAELIFRGDFKIASITSVLGFDGLANMKYALISRSFLIPEIFPDDDRYLEIRIPTDSDTSVGDILRAARCYDIDLHRLNTVTFDTDDGERTFFTAVFRCGGRDFSCFLAYLTLFTDEFTPVGIYKNIE